MSTRITLSLGSTVRLLFIGRRRASVPPFGTLLTLDDRGGSLLGARHGRRSSPSDQGLDRPAGNGKADAYLDPILTIGSIVRCPI
jgi:hypothetical protein